MSFSDKIQKMQDQIDIINFKTLFGLTIENSDNIKSNFEKMVSQLNSNNRNIILSEQFRSNIMVLETKYKREFDDIKKSKLKRKINSLRKKMNNYKSEIKDVDANGYKYGVNYEKEIVGGKYITSDIINQSKKMKETMEMIEKLSKRKNENVRLNIFVIRMLNNFEFIQNILYERYSLFINHKIDGIFEEYCHKFFKNIKRELLDIVKNKKQLKRISLDFSKLAFIIFFIIQNEKNINTFYKLTTIYTEPLFLNKFVSYQDKIGQVLIEEDNMLHILFDMDVEVIDKELVNLVKSYEWREVKIIRGNYKGFLGTVKKQNGKNLTVEIVSYSSIFKNIQLTIDDITVISDSSIKESKMLVVVPKNKENKDLYSISRFLFSQIFQDNSSESFGNNDDLYFNKLYKFTMTQINDIIYTNGEKIINGLKNKKLQQLNNKQGVLDFKITSTLFRTITKNNIKILKDNSLNYLNEDDQEKKFQEIVKSPEEIKRKLELHKEDKKKQYKQYTNMIKNSINELNLSFF